MRMTHLNLLVRALAVSSIVVVSTLPSIAQDTSVSASVSAQTSATLERGYRTGYSDGFPAGVTDAARGAARNYAAQPDYQRADRGFAPAFGRLETYRDGYQQGFVAGYNAGFDHRPFESTIPPGLAAKGVDAAAQTDQPAQSAPPVDSTASSRVPPGRGLVIPEDTVFRVELLNRLSTDVSKRGDRFEARVVEPSEYQGAIIEGRVARVKKAGRMKGTAELQLEFNSIRLNNAEARFTAQLLEVEGGRNTGARDVDKEGGVKSGGSTKDNVTRIGAAAGVGAVIGAIAGGGSGAVVGAAIGGAVGTGSVVASKGHDIYLPAGQALRIRTTAPSQMP